jgi:hypothetical protein
MASTDPTQPFGEPEPHAVSVWTAAQLNLADSINLIADGILDVLAHAEDLDDVRRRLVPLARGMKAASGTMSGTFTG